MGGDTRKLHAIFGAALQFEKNFLVPDLPLPIESMENTRVVEN